jgi:hypothetical protein
VRGELNLLYLDFRRLHWQKKPVHKQTLEQHGQNTDEYENMARTVNKKIRADKRGMEQKIARDGAMTVRP